VLFVLVQEVKKAATIVRITAAKISRFIIGGVKGERGGVPPKLQAINVLQGFGVPRQSSPGAIDPVITALE